MDSNVPLEMGEGCGAAIAGRPNSVAILWWCSLLAAISLFCGCTLIKPNPGPSDNAAASGSVTDAPVKSVSQTAAQSDKTTTVSSTPIPAAKPVQGDSLVLTGSRPPRTQPANASVRETRTPPAESLKGAEKLISFTTPSTERQAQQLRVSGSKTSSGASVTGTSVVLSSGSQLIVKGPPRPLRTPGESSRLLTILILGLSITIIVLGVHATRRRMPRGRARKTRSDDLDMPSDFRMKDSAIEPVKAMGMLMTTRADETGFWERFGGVMSVIVQWLAGVISKVKDACAYAVAFVRKHSSSQHVEPPAEKPLDSVAR